MLHFLGHGNTDRRSSSNSVELQLDLYRFQRRHSSVCSETDSVISMGQTSMSSIDEDIIQPLPHEGTFTGNKRFTIAPLVSYRYRCFFITLYCEAKAHPLDVLHHPIVLLWHKLLCLCCPERISHFHKESRCQRQCMSSKTSRFLAVICILCDSCELFHHIKCTIILMIMQRFSVMDSQCVGKVTKIEQT